MNIINRLNIPDDIDDLRHLAAHQWRSRIRTLTSPIIKDLLPISTVVEAEYHNDNTYIDGYDLPPSDLYECIESLLPDQPKRRNRTRGIFWKSQETVTVKERERSIEAIGLFSLPEDRGGVTTIAAYKHSSYDYRRNAVNDWVAFQFPNVNSELEWPDVAIVSRSYTTRSISGREASYDKAAPGIGAVITRLLAQTDEPLILAQETANFLES
jgi:hypothetical protein